MKKAYLAFVFIMALCLSSCAGSTIFPPLTTEIAGVTGLAIDAANNRLYLVNANEKVAYEWQQGSFQVYDITNPLAPVLMQTTATDSFSGKISLDTVGKRAYLTNRYSDTDDATNDRLFVFNVDEASADFMTFTEVTLGLNPFGIACCYPADRMWIAEGGKDDTYVSQYVDRGNLSVGDVDMLVNLDNGGEFTQNETSDLVILGNQAFYSRTRGGIVVINMDEAGVAGAEPVDYWIEDIYSPRGIATDGTYIYVTTEENLDNGWRGYLIVLDPSLLVPLTTNTEAMVVDKDDDNLLVAMIELNERRDPQEVLVTTDYVFVSAAWNDDDYVHVIDRATLTWNREIATGESPFAMALYAPGGVEKYVYVVNQISNTIQLIDIATLAIVATYP